MNWRGLTLTGAAVLAIAAALWHLVGAASGLTISRASVGSTPVTIFAAADPAPAPVVVIAHGFAGSQQLMQSFALALARNGYIALTFDFLGHGRNTEPLRGSITEEQGATKALVEELAEVGAFARRLPQSDGRLAVLGHSMASDIVVRYAQAHPEVEATVAVSMFAPGITATSPRNLLVVVGALEPAPLRDEAYRAVAMASDGKPQPDVTYGDFGKGTARRMVFSPSVEHISVLYNRASLAAAVAWLDAAFSRDRAEVKGVGLANARGLYIVLLFLGLTLLARSVAPLLPQAAASPLGAGLPWRRLLPAAILPALLTPLILWKLPTNFLPVLVGDYLAAHFALYGFLTALALLVLGRGIKPPQDVTSSYGKLAIATIAVAFYGVVIFGLAIDLFVTSFVPVSGRVVLVLAMLAGTLPYFLADEWLTRGATAPRGAYLVTKLCFLLSLGIAVVLNPEKLFFLIIILPVILLFFVIYGLFSAWSYRSTNDPRVAALANAIALAWAIAVTFPLLAR